MPSGIMFHHFHGKSHIKSQGSINQKQFNKIISFLKKKYNLLDANIFLERCLSGLIKKKDICLTFDDGLKSQFDLAFPILQKKNIKAFYFIYSSAFKKPSNLEIFRDFRFRSYKKIDDFYNDFFSIFEKAYFKINKNNKIYKNYLKNYNFYSLNDRIFRYLRDKVLDSRSYLKIIKKMMKQKDYDYLSYSKNLIMSKNNIKRLIKEGNIVGLHSHSHEVDLVNKNYKHQLKEYTTNLKFFKKEFNISCNSASYPFGRYNKDTLKVFEKIGIKVGFLSSKKKVINKNNLEIERIDHNKFV